MRICSWLLLALLICGFNDTPRCYKELEINFFDDAIVLQTFSLYTNSGVTQSQWPWLLRNLKDAESRVPGLIKARTNAMRPDPSAYPFQKDTMRDILLETLYQVFYQVMSKYTPVQEESIKDMFEQIKYKQKHRLESCLNISH